MSSETEKWVTIQDFVKRPRGISTPHFEISDLGRVRRNGEIWEPCRSGGKYFSLMLRGKQHALHRLVCEIFNGPCPDGMGCYHRDGDPRNNRAENVTWGTASERHLNEVRRGTHAGLKRRGKDGLKGVQNPAAKLTNKNVRTIRRLYTTGETQLGIAIRYRVAKSTIGRILRHQNWKHLT